MFTKIKTKIKKNIFLKKYSHNVTYKKTTLILTLVSCIQFISSEKYIVRINDKY